MAEMQSNRNDDVFGRTDKQFGAPSIDSLALKYSKAQLQQMAQMGRIPPIYAVMAGMAQDRVQLNNSQAPKTTVAQDTFSQPVAKEATQSAADISKAYGGLMSIPRPGEKYNQDNFATGGIVAFQKGGASWESLEKADPSKNYPPLSGAFERLGQSPDMRIDPATGEAVSLGEYMRRQELRPQIMPSQGAEPFQGSRLNLSPKDRLAAAEADLSAGKTPLAVVKAREKIGETQPAGPLAAMAQKEEPAMGLQQIMQQLPKRTPADTTGLVDTPETIAKNKDDLMYRTVGYTGAEMMAGKSPFALVNIGEALSKGFSSYAQQIEAHKKTTKDDIKDLAAIKRAEQALEQGDVKMGVDIMTNELNNKSAMKRMEMQVKGSLEGARIGAGSKPLDIPNILMYGSPEEKERARDVVSMMNTGKDKTPQEVRIAASTLLGKNDDYATLSTSDKPAERARAAKMLSDMEAYIRTGDMGGGGGGGKGEVNKSNPLLTGK